jgi:hypothetical protein
MGIGLLYQLVLILYHPHHHCQAKRPTSYNHLWKGAVLLLNDGSQGDDTD